MPSATLNRIIWLSMLVVLAVLAFRTRDTVETYFATVGHLDVSDGPEREDVFLRWTGKIEAPMASRIREVYRRHSDDKRPFVLSLSSPGGDLQHGGEVIRLLREITATRTLETEVEAGAMCASMCVPVYLQGQRRVAAPDARFMFHQVSFREYLAREDRDVPQSATTAATSELFLKYFTSAGVPEAWTRQMINDVAGGREVWKTARDLVDAQAGVVQQLSN